MPRVRSDNDARYALRASFVDQHGEVLQGDTIVIEEAGPGSVFGAYKWSDKEDSTDDRKVSTDSQADPTLLTTLFLSRKTQNDVIADTLLDVYIADGSIIYIQKKKDPSIYLAMTSTADTHTAEFEKYREYDVTYLSHSGVLEKDDDVIVDIVNGTGGAGDPRITDTDILNWNAAYNWGDHSTVKYTLAGNNGTALDLNTLTGDSEVSTFNVNANAPDGNAWYNIVNVRHRGGVADGNNYGGQLAWKMQTAGSLFYRYHDGGTWSSWTEVGGGGPVQAGAGGGQYGSVFISGGATGGYEGYNINGRAVFMHNNGTTTGIYNDVNNHWLFVGTHNGASAMYNAGSQKIYTYGSGGRVTGNLLASSDVYAYYSDVRLKDVVGRIEKPLESIGAIDTFYYTHNDKARELGYEGSERQVGVSAQSVQAVLPEVVARAPIDDDGEGGSVTGEEYITVQYHRIVPLLIEGIKELTEELKCVKLELEEMKRG